jgi:tetratricopeptide (TPR) repeat protein
MFTDIVGFTALTQQDEPLALELLDEHRQKIRPLLAQHRGREVKTLGDGFLVEFPDAADAVRCGVEIQRIFFDRNRRFPKKRIDLRIGIHAGEVIPQGDDVLGDTVNVASRIVPMSDPGGICLSRVTLEDLGGAPSYPCTPLGPAQLKGIALPVALFRVDLPWRATPGGPGPLSETTLGRWDPGVQESPFVGRVYEIDQLQTFVDSIPQGKGGALFLCGEAGTGKSRLGRETRAYAFLRGVRTLTATSTEIHGGVPYAPWLQLLRRVVREEPGDRLARMCGPYAGDIAKLVPETLEKIGPVPSVPSGDPAEERLRLFDGVTGFLLALAKDQPLLLFVEDLGWADAASLQLLHHLLRNLGGAPIGFLGTYRPVEVPGPTPLGHFLEGLNRERLLRTVTLGGLGPTEVARLADHILGNGGITPSLRDMIYDRTGGNPFFVEEVVREIVREKGLTRTSNGWSLSREGGIRVPSSVRSILEERLRGFDLPTREVLQTAAVAGQEFDLGVLERVVPMTPEELAGRLDSVREAGFLREERRKGGRIVYTFHDRQLRDLLYDDLSLAGRRARHLRIARGMEVEFPDGRGEHLDELAHHFLEGSDPQKSLEYALRAAEQASGVYAHEAAADHLRVALDLLESHPDPEMRLKVLERIGSVYAALGDTPHAVQRWKELAETYEAGSAAARAGDVYRRIALTYWESSNDAASFFESAERALRLLRPLPAGPELARVCSELAMGYFWFGRAADGRRMSEEAVRLADDLHLEDIEASALLNLAAISSLREIDSARGYLARWKDLRHVGGPEDRPLALPFGEYLQVAELQEGLTGDSRVALRWYDALIETSHSARFFSQEMIGRYMAAGTGGVDRMRRECDAILALHEKFGLPLIDVIEQRLAWRRFFDGEFEAALEAYTAAAAQTERNAPQYLGLWLLQHDQASMLMDLGRPEEAFELLVRSRRSAEQHGLPMILTFSVLDTLLRLLQVSLQLGREEMASATYRDLDALLTPLDHDLGRAFRAWGQALWNGHRQDWPAAMAEFDRSIESWKQVYEPVNLARTLRDLADACQQCGQIARARATLEEVAQLYAEMGAARHVAMTRSVLESLTAG